MFLEINGIGINLRAVIRYERLGGNRILRKDVFKNENYLKTNWFGKSIDKLGTMYYVLGEKMNRIAISDDSIFYDDNAIRIHLSDLGEHTLILKDKDAVDELIEKIKASSMFLP